MATDLHTLQQQVVDEESFLRFLDALATDKAEEDEIESRTPSSPFGRGALGWENGSISTFLSAAFHWGLASSKGLQHYEKPSNPWRRCADILYAGKFYE